MMTEKKSRTGVGGRPKGKPQPQLKQYPGILWEQRLSWLRMRCQAKYRDEDFTLTWEEYQKLWDGKWHLRGSIKGCLTLSRKNWDKGWSMSNIEVITREQHWHKQNIARRGKTYKKKPKDVD